MNGVTLKQLRYVQALARQGHFGRAAEVSGISQPALSMQVRALEAMFGLPLFSRGPRDVRPTAFGEAVLARADAILQAVDDLGDLARASQNRLSGRLGIGIIPTIAPYLLPRILDALSGAHPELDVQVRETVTPRLIEDLSSGRIDTAILALPMSEPSLTEIPLGAEDFVLVRPAEQRGAPIPAAAELAEMRLLLLEEGHCFRDQALSFCAGRGARLQESLEGSSLSTLVQMVAAGLGVTLIPRMAVPVETRGADVDVVGFPAPAPARQIGMVWRTSSPLAPLLLPVSDTVRDAIDLPPAA